MADPTSTRPENVPSDATWCAEDSEWVLGPKNDDGVYHGEVRYWRPDGSLVSISTEVNGKVHGEATRFHENGDVAQIAFYEMAVFHGRRAWFWTHGKTTEIMHSPGMSTEIWNVEMVYENGVFKSMHYFLEDETEVDGHGNVPKKKPENVPESALPNKTGWISAVWNEDGEKEGEARFFDHDGTLKSIENYTNGVLNGSYSVFDARGNIQTKFEYVDNERRGSFCFYHQNGKLSQSGNIDGNQWIGRFKNFDIKGNEISSLEIGIPNPSEKAGELNAEEAKGIEKLVKQVYNIEEPSPVLLSTLIAIGWGGDEERDIKRARHARLTVSRIGESDEELWNVFTTLRLDKAPRIRSADRLQAFLKLCSELERVESNTLQKQFFEEGGTGEVASLVAGGEACVDFLLSRFNEKGTRLDLTGFGLQSIPEEIRFLPKTETIEVGDNALRTIPDALCDLPFLNRLKLSGNQISSLPKSMTRLHSLRALYLASCGMRHIPEVIFELEKLRTLDLSGNFLGRIPDDFSNLKNLKTLWLGRNQLKSLPNSFAKISSLRFVHFVGIPWEVPPDCLWEMEGLENLWLESSHLRELPSEISQLKNLKTLCLWYSNLSSLPDTLFEMTHLEEIRIRHNPLADGVVDKLKEALPNCTIY